MKVVELEDGIRNSPITAEILSKARIISAARVDERNRQIYSLEDGNIFHHSLSGPRPVPHSFDGQIGSNVHGYGGGAIAMDSSGSLIYASADSNAVYRQNPESGLATQLVPPTRDHYADFDCHPLTSRWVVAVKEEFRIGKMSRTTIVMLDTVLKEQIELQAGSDFYTHPRISPDGTKLSWLQWDFLSMPWTGAVLRVAELEGRTLNHVATIQGHQGVGQPRRGRDGSLYFVSDISGWGQLYRADLTSKMAEHISLRGLETVEFGGAEFSLGSHTYFQMSDDLMVAAYSSSAVSSVIMFNLKTFEHVTLDVGLNDISYDAMRRISNSSFTIIGASSTYATALYSVTIDHLRTPKCALRMLSASLDMEEIPSYELSLPMSLDYPRLWDNERIGTGHGFLLAPLTEVPPACVLDTLGPTLLPPCIIVPHGGPTKHTRPSINLEHQYFASRGYAVVLLNHVGSTGYGKLYREELTGRWGTADTADAASCAIYLAKQGMVDPGRIGISGISAGGYCTLQSLCQYPEIWAAGISIAGISNMAAFASTTHKFESQYHELLVFGTGARASHDHETTTRATQEQRHDVNKRVSPIHQVDAVRSPLMLIQGLDDIVVTPAQAIDMNIALQESYRTRGEKLDGYQVEMVLFKDEGHGFHLHPNIQKCFEMQIAWWNRHLAGPLERKHIGTIA